MAGLEKQSKKEDKNKTKKESSRGTRDDIEKEDDEETYYKSVHILLYIFIVINLIY